MKLIQELMAINEAEAADQGTDLTAMKQSPEKNLKAVDLILRADGDIPIGKQSRTQCDKLGEEDGSQIFYVAVDEPHGNVEAYVVVDKRGNFSYYDFTDEVVVVDGKFAQGGGDRPSNDWRDELEDVIGEYKFESGKVAPGGIKAYMDLLKRAD